MSGSDGTTAARRERARRRSRRAAAVWIVIVALASLVDPAPVLGSLGGSGATATAGSTPLSADVFTFAHLLAYAVLAWLLTGGMVGEFGNGRRATIGVVVAAVALAWTVGIGIELLQAPLAARTASVTDAIVNGIGAIAGGGLRTVIG